MMDIAVRVTNVGKRYQLGAISSGKLYEVLADAVNLSSRRRRRAASHSAGPGHIWALSNVSFEVPRGQILGIIGPNGAGKSTLLKILSRITRPTVGRVEIHGRVGSLLEVGTGFHGELSGRENIYLSGALLGMRKAEIDRKLDEIIAFAGIERFIDTPVKRYSSGMYVRLGFAVAAHLEPDILIVDEVLAVGDVSFQRKCLNKLEEVRQHDRTVLFVSHNMDAVARLCQRVILISNGIIQQDGPAAEVTSSYLLSSFSISSEREWPTLEVAPGNDIARLRRVRVRTDDGVTAKAVDIRRSVGLEMVYDVLQPGHSLIPYYEVYNETGLCLFMSQDLEPEWRRRPRPVGRYTSVAWIPGNFLAEGAFLISAGLYTNDTGAIHFRERETIAFHVIDGGTGDSARGDWGNSWDGLVRPMLPWSTERSEISDTDFR